MSVPNHERDEAYLEELMHEFRVPDAPSLNDALHLLQERYRVLWSVFHDPSQWSMLLGADPTRQGNQLPDAAGTEVLVRTVHGVLYDGIIRNAGEYRSKLDLNEGAVYFGGQDRFYRSEGKFKGSDPEHILNDVRMAIQAYLERRDSPVEAVCVFYQLFVKAHPFYDANGRIARLFASSILRMHGLEIRWDEMEGKNNEFIRRLNQVHKHPTSPRTYLGYLTNHVRKFTHPIVAADELYD